MYMYITHVYNTVCDVSGLSIYSHHPYKSFHRISICVSQCASHYIVHICAHFDSCADCIYRLYSLWMDQSSECTIVSSPRSENVVDPRS